MNRFRTLRADEIDCRVAQITKSGAVSLLLYKDARCDQNILDETVGPMNWQRHHNRDNANCVVSIWDKEKQQWIEKEDVGTESRTEREKGLASDSFKRACFNWGIGRELYTAPFILVRPDKCNVKDGKCYDNFTVQEIEYQPDGAREIRHLVIYNEKKGCVAFEWKTGERKAREDYEPAAPTTPAATPARVTPMSPAEAAASDRKNSLLQAAMLAHESAPKTYLNKLLAKYNVNKAEDLTGEVYQQIRNDIIADITNNKKGGNAA